MKKVKIVSVYYRSIYPVDYGGGTRIYNILRNEKRIMPYLITPSPLPPDIEGFPVEAPPFYKLTLPFDSRILNYFSPGCSLKMYNILKRIKPKWIKSEGMFPFIPLYWISRRLNIQIILDTPDVYYIRARYKYGEKSIITKICKKLENFCLNKADLVITVSEIDKEKIKKIYNISIDKIIVVPNGVDIRYNNSIDNIKYRYNIRGKLILFMGKLDYSPNQEAVDIIINKIMPRVLKEMPDTTFMIIGINPPNIIKEQLIFTGYVEDVKSYIASADVAIAPIISGSGTRLKILEYMGEGRPVVSTFLGAEGLEVVDGENILIADDFDTFADKIILLLNNSDISRKIGEASKKLMENKYTWEKIGKNFEDKLINYNININKI